MLATKYEYPGDPVATAMLMFGLEFKQQYTGREIVFHDGDKEPTRIPVEDAICDSCNASVGDFEPCAVTISRLYCWDCYKQWIKPHVKAA